MTGRIGLPPHIQELAVANVTETALLLAEDKNVPVTSEHCALFARNVVELLDVLSIQRIARGDIKAFASAAASINRLLDVYAATEVLYLVRILEGHSHPDRSQMIAEAEVWMREALANDTSDRRLRWPDLLEMAQSHLRARASGPVSILFPNNGSMRAKYLLDREATGSGWFAGSDCSRPPRCTWRRSRAHTTASGGSGGRRSNFPNFSYFFSYGDFMNRFLETRETAGAIPSSTAGRMRSASARVAS
jgi:hypothetical protein